MNGELILCLCFWAVGLLGFWWGYYVGKADK
jgi:hypothetical protein